MRAVRDAVARLGEELVRLDLEVRAIGPTCSPLPPDKLSAADVIAAGTKLPRITNGVADGTVESRELQNQFPVQWTALRTKLENALLTTAERALTVRWCIKRTQVCFDTQAAIDAAGRVQFEPVLSMGAWQARLEVQPRDVARRILFLNGLGATIAEYKVSLLYRGDACLVSGTATIDIAVVSLDNALFQETRQTDAPVVYKGSDTCEQSTEKRDWLRARATVELKTLWNPSVPQTPIITTGVTTAVTIRFDVSAAGEDHTQVDK